MRATHAYLGSLCALLIGCQDAAEPALTGDELVVSAEVLASDIREIGSLQAFDVRLEVRGSPRLGEPFEIVALVAANAEVGEAEIEIMVPELEAARLEAGQSGGFANVPLGRRLSPAARSRRPMLLGSQILQPAQLMINEPGYYRVIVTARASSTAPEWVGGRPLQSIVSKEQWILLTEDGSRITDAFDPSIIPAGKPTVPGPWRSSQPANAPMDAPAPSLPCQEDCEPPCTGCGCGGCANYWTEFSVSYWSEDARMYVPLPKAYLSYLKSTGGGGLVTLDMNGFARVNSCPRGSETWTVAVDHRNADVTVFPFPGVLQATITNAACGKRNDYQSTHGYSRVFDNFVRTIGPSRALLGRSRGHINVYVTLERVNGAGAFYSRDDDHISMWEGEMLGTRGVFVVAHEYGHAVHEKALNGNKGGNCPTPHFFSQPSNATCAFSEGFANYHSAATRGSAAQHTSSIESPISFPNGILSEQAVAGFFYDITDPANEPHDAVGYPGSYLADLIRTCEINPYPLTGGWYRTDALDGIIYCMERTVVASHEDTYFRIRSLDPTGQREAATEPGGASQTSHVRAIWLKNLYAQ